jgi:hypothetical protein
MVDLNSSIFSVITMCVIAQKKDEFNFMLLNSSIHFVSLQLYSVRSIFVNIMTYVLKLPSPFWVLLPKYYSCIIFSFLLSFYTPLILSFLSS